MWTCPFLNWLIESLHTTVVSFSNCYKLRFKPLSNFVNKGLQVNFNLHFSPNKHTCRRAHTDTHKTKPVTAVLTRRTGHTSWMMGVWAAVVPLRTQPLKRLKQHITSLYWNLLPWLIPELELNMDTCMHTYIYMHKYTHIHIDTCI